MKTKLSTRTLLLVGLTALTLCCTISCKTKIVVVPADREVKFDGTNYIVPKAVMLDLMHRLNSTNY